MNKWHSYMMSHLKNMGGTVKGFVVDYTMDDEIDRGFGIDFKDFLRRMNVRLNKVK